LKVVLFFKFVPISKFVPILKFVQICSIGTNFEIGTNSKPLCRCSTSKPPLSSRRREIKYNYSKEKRKSNITNQKKIENQI
jgi:hypothetical protein